MRYSLSLAVLLLTAAIVADWANSADPAPAAAAHDHAVVALPLPEHPLAALKHAVAVIHPTHGNACRGMARFEQLAGDKVKVTADVEGLRPNAEHGFHIHEFGDCSSADGMSAGGHYDPQGAGRHGRPTDALGHRHAGDLGNLKADAAGKARLELTIEGVTLGGRNAVIGRGLIVHAGADDFGQPLGNAGGRIGCGVIGVAKAP